MYELRSVHKIACEATNNIFPTCKILRNKAVNIWQIPFKTSSGRFLEVMHSKFSCEEWFIACYWICVFTALIGLSEAIQEFIRVYSDRDYVPMTFWSRSYRNIPLETQRKFRFFGSTLNTALSVLLIYGSLHFRYAFSLPWIIVNALIIALESFYWMSNFLRNKVFKWKPFLSVTFLLLRLLIVIHVSMVISELRID